MMKRKKPVTPEAARLKMAGLCARGEHCRFEIAEKLRKMELSKTDIEAILDYLESNRFIDSSRFATSFVRDKVRFAGWGFRKVRAALALKRIPQEDIMAGIEEFDSDEYQAMALRVAGSKLRSSHLDLNLAEDRMKLFRSMASRGFESNLISRCISTLRRQNQED